MQHLSFRRANTQQQMHTHVHNMSDCPAMRLHGHVQRVLNHSARKQFAHPVAFVSSKLVQAKFEQIPSATGVEGEERLDRMKKLTHGNLTCNKHKDLAQFIYNSGKAFALGSQGPVVHVHNVCFECCPGSKQQQTCPCMDVSRSLGLFCSEAALHEMFSTDHHVAIVALLCFGSTAVSSYDRPYVP